jgi:RNA polymerase sigma-70 factor (ECF subfamily)
MNQLLEEVFLEAIEKNKQKLLRVCSVYADDDDDKKDLFQEALINIWQSMPSFQQRSSLSTWMFRITLNVCMRLHSKAARNRDRFQKMDSIRIENIPDQEAHPDDQTRLNSLRNCIKNLHDADKAIITLYLEDLSYREISAITGLTENNVAVKVKRIKDKLLNCITEKYDRK